MISPVSGANAISQISASQQTAAVAQVQQQATLQPDKASISTKGQQMSAGDVDHDGDSH
jgi:hypothetical protein